MVFLMLNMYGSEMNISRYLANTLTSFDCWGNFPFNNREIQKKEILLKIQESTQK